MNTAKRYKITLILVVCVGLISLAGFLVSVKHPVRPNILLITIDALRADHLGCYGYQRNTSPNIDKLAKEGVVFLNCFATGPQTVYSFSGFLTGRYLAIGRDNAFFDNILDKKFTTLAGYLKSAGYFTAAFIQNGHLTVGKGFEQGFDYYSQKNERGAHKLTTSALNFLNNYRNNKPFFIWLHYLDVHAPYTFRESYFKIFGSDELYKKNDKLLELCPKIQAEPFKSQSYIPRAVFHENRYNLNYYIACYDGDIAYTDLQIGRLLDRLKHNTVIIISADHGESLGEHNTYFSHGENIYDELLHIPLIISDNRLFKGGKRITTIVSSVDIVPTILNIINSHWEAFNKNRFDGESLKQIVDGKDIKRKYVYSYSPFYAFSIRNIRMNTKFILHDKTEELYFLPDEYKNHISDESQGVSNVKNELRQALKKWRINYPVSADINSRRIHLDEGRKNFLKSLGYLQ